MFDIEMFTHRIAPITVILFAQVLATSCLYASDESNQTRPNVVLIMTDDQGYGDMGCHGNPIVKTPHIDQLYGDSVRLTNFHVDPTCSPTRAALMTGRYSTRTGVWHTVMGRHMPRPGEMMMPRVFQESGYRTAVYGKWHLGDNFPYRPQDRGFEHVLIHGGGGVGQIPDFWGNDYFDDTYCQNGIPRSFNGYCTDVFFNEAIEFIADNHETPFFVYLSTNAPHGPYRVPSEYSRRYQTKVGDDSELSKFYGMITNIDDNVGRLLAHLRTSGLDKNTIVIFMTDNGTARGATFSDYRGNDGHLISGFNAGMRGRKGSPYEGGHRTPCFVHWPAGGITGGKDVNQLTAHIDVMPTLIDLCRLNRPSEIQFDGVNLAGLLSGRSSLEERHLFVHHQELPSPEKHRFGCVMNGRWRLITRNDLTSAPQFELYDIRADPGQKKDLSEQHSSLVTELRAAYDQWWNSMAEDFETPSRIAIGDNRQNPTQLTCFEWHGSRKWWQNNIRSATVDNGFWELNIAKSARYEITLRRWPKEAAASITTAIDGGKAIEAITARIQIGELTRSLPVPPNASSISFRVRLERGASRLQSWFVNGDGFSLGAYYAEIRRVD